MKLYFIPFACSLASRIAFAEAGIDATFVPVAADKTLPDGGRLAEVNPMNMVPVLELDDGRVLTENVAVLSHIAGLAPEGVLAPAPGTPAGNAMLSWLAFIATELHSTIYHPLFSSDAAVRPFALGQVERRFRHLSEHLTDRDFLLDRFTVADAYLFVVLNWSETAGVPIGDWPVLKEWRARIRRRPSVAAAVAEELPLFQPAT